MKKFLKNIFTLTLVAVSVFSFAGCKKKKTAPPDPVSPTVNAYVVDREFYVGEVLSEIDVFTTDGDTSGDIFWVNENQTLIEGENECEWKFVPTDISGYTSKTGSLILTAIKRMVKPTVNPTIENQNIYAENKLSSVEVELSQNDTAGTLTWANPDMILEVGENICAWKFIPTNAEEFEQASGTIKINAVAQQVLSVEVETNPTKLNYVAFETFETSGLSLKVTYDGGKVETITTGYQVGYQQGDSFVAGDNKVIISYEEKNCDVSVAVSKVEIEKPQLASSEFVYDGTDKTASLVPSDNDNLYEISNNTKKNAGEYNASVSIIDFSNYKWINETNQTINLQFKILKAVQITETMAYAGTYDGLVHNSTVTNQINTNVYYGLEELNEQNYNSLGSLEKIDQLNAGVYTIYYYSCGNDNYLPKSGQITSTIEKAQARVAVGVDKIYSFAGEKSSKAQSNDVTIYGINDTILQGNNIFEFVYYSSYTNEAENQKTTISDGAETIGGAPSKAGEYVVHATYLESENYLSAWGTLDLIIYNEDVGLFAVNDEPAHAWIEKTFNSNVQVYDDYVTGYFEVKKVYNGYIYELSASMKVVEYDEDSGSPISETEYSGKVMYVGTDLMFIANTAEQFKLIVTDNGTSETLTISQGETEIKTLSKWELPTFLGKYEKDTAGDGITENSYLEISVSYGTLNFVFDIKYYQNSQLITHTYEGVVKNLSGKLTFYLNSAPTSSFMRQVVYNDTTLTLNSSCIIQELQGEYTKV